MKKKGDAFLLTDNKMFYEKLGASTKPEYTNKFTSSFEFIYSITDQVKNQFVKIEEQPICNIFLEFETDNKIQEIYTIIKNNKNDLKLACKIGYSINNRTGGTNGTGPPNLEDRYSNLKTVYDILLEPFFIFVNNILDVVSTNLTAYKCADIIDRVLEKESIKIDEIISEFIEQEKSFAYEESESSLKVTFDKLMGSLNKFLNELVKLKKIELYSIIKLEEITKTMEIPLNNGTKPLSEITENIEMNTSDLRTAKTGLIEQVEKAQKEELESSRYKDPIEVILQAIENYRRKSDAMVSFIVSCFRFREAILNKHIDRVSIVANLILTKVKTIDTFIFLRLAETAHMFNLELNAKELEKTLGVFYKTFDQSFSDKNAGLVISFVDSWNKKGPDYDEIKTDRKIRFGNRI